MFDPAKFVEERIEWIKRTVGDEKALAAVSGGVDSSTATALTYRAIGDRLRSVFMDTGFMRQGEPEWVVKTLGKAFPVELIDVKEEFYKAIVGLSDAEEKRKAFREVFYNVLSRLAKEFGAEWLVQGTTAPDWIETSGGIKTQHNVLEQIGINPRRKWGFKLLEPLVDLYKDQVRAVARYLGLPEEIASRQPFPGPGLLVRSVGKLTLEKLDVVRKATFIAEPMLAQLNPSQYFAAGWEDEWDEAPELTRIIKEVLGEGEAYVFKVKATGVKGDERAYGPVVAIRNARLDYDALARARRRIMEVMPEATHVLYEIRRRGRGGYAISLRAVVTEDFMTADICRPSRELLEKIASEIMSNDERVSAVLYDVTPKPPATIEYE